MLKDILKRENRSPHLASANKLHFSELRSQPRPTGKPFPVTTVRPGCSFHWNGRGKARRLVSSQRGSRGTTQPHARFHPLGLAFPVCLYCDHGLPAPWARPSLLPAAEHGLGPADGSEPSQGARHDRAVFRLEDLCRAPLPPGAGRV